MKNVIYAYRRKILTSHCMRNRSFFDIDVKDFIPDEIWRARKIRERKIQVIVLNNYSKSHTKKLVLKWDKTITTSTTSLATECNVGGATIMGIKSNKSKILEYRNKLSNESNIHIDRSFKLASNY